MANVNTGKKVIGILTGGGDVPGLNPAIRAVTVRALREGYEVIGLRRGWAGLVDIVREKDYDNSNNFEVLTEEIVNKAGRTGGTFIHTSRTRPSTVKKDSVPEHLQDQYQEKTNDLTPEVAEEIVNHAGRTAARSSIPRARAPAPLRRIPCLSICGISIKRRSMI